MYSLLKKVVGQNQFIDVACNVTGQEQICLNVKLMLTLKHIAFETVTLAWQDCFQMGSTASRTVVVELCSMVSASKML